MNEAAAADGLARVQSESRISASTWRQWCARLEVDPAVAVELWDEVCHPLMVATGSAPDLALLLQLRAARPDLYIGEFREELPAILLTSTLLASLGSDKIGGGRGRSALLGLYRHLAQRAGEAPVGRAFVGHAAGLAVLAAVLPGDFALPALAKLLTAGRTTLADLARLGRRHLADDERGRLAAAALDESLALLGPPPPPPPRDGPADEGDGADRDRGQVGGQETPAPTDLEADGAEATVRREGARGDGRTSADLETDGGDEVPARQEGARGDEEASAAAATGCQDEAAPAPDPGPPRGSDGGALTAVRAALAVLFGDGGDGDASVRAERLQAIQSFDPLAARIPSMEEARRAAGQALAGGEGRRRALGGGGRPTARPALAARPARGARGGRPARPSVGVGAGVQVLRPAAAAVGATAAGASAGPATGADGKLAAPAVGAHEIDAAVGRIGLGLAKLRELDERVWQLFVDPAGELADPRSLAEAVATADAPAQLAGDALRLAAQQQGLRRVLALPPDRRLNQRRMDLEAEAFINTVQNHRRAFDADARALIPAPRILDHAAASLVRVEALRAAVLAVREAPDPAAVTAQAVAGRYEAVLSDITFLADRSLVAAARQRADVDAAVVLAAVAADAWIEAVRAAALDFARGVVAGGAAASMAALAETLELQPLALAPPVAGPAAGPFPDELARDTPLGEIVDALRGHVLRRAWAALQPAHRPQETVERLDVDLRRALRTQARITPRRERHQQSPKVALPVTSLEKLSGNPELAHLFVRLTVDGHLLFVEDYEDGGYIDLFELRQNKKRQMHARARERARDEETGELLLGASYLYSLGRTHDPFARTAAEVLAARVVGDDGEPVLFE